MGSDVLRFLLVLGVIVALMVFARSSLKRHNLRPSQPRGALVPGPPPALQSISTAAAGLPPAPAVPPPPVERSGALTASRDQAVLLRRHFPPRPGTLSHWGGVPLVPPGFTWPFIPLPDGRDRALTFVLQLDCSAIPEPGRLGLMPDRGQLYVFLDLDWGHYWRWSVRYEDVDPQGLVPALVPAALPRAYPQREYWGWPQRDQDWPTLLPAWSIDPVLVKGDGVAPPRADLEDDEERSYWPGTLDLGRALGEVEGAIVPEHYYRNRFDADGRLIRPFTTFPQDWQAVRIVLGHLGQRDVRRHLEPYVALGTYTEEQAAAFASSLQGWHHHWSVRAQAAPPTAALSQEDSDAVWQFLLDFQQVTKFGLGNAVNESLDATLSANPDTASWLPAEALELVRIRHALASRGDQGLHIVDTERMLCAPSYVQGDAEQRIDEWLLLLEMSSDPQIGHHFAEGVYQFWIRPADLAARRFDRVELTASAY